VKVLELDQITQKDIVNDMRFWGQINFEGHISPEGLPVT
jgi:hypothetical protein